MSSNLNYELSKKAAEPVSLNLLPKTGKIDSFGELSVGGVSVKDMVKEFSTPLFIYDEEHLRQNLLEAKTAFPAGVAYASKAFLCMAMAELVGEYGINIDVASMGEMYIALNAGIGKDRIVLHGNNKSLDEINFACRNGIKIVVDSFDEINALESILSGLKSRSQALIRITPGVEAHTHEFIKTGHEDSKFGFPLADAMADKAIAKLAGISNLDLIGIHNHIGSQIFELESFAEALSVTVPIVEKYDFSELCIGGGLGVAYLSDEQAPSISQWAKTVMAASRQAGIADKVSITAEPGRSIVAQTAITCYTVGTIKKIPQVRTYLAVDGGMSDNPRPVLYGSGYEVFLVSRANANRPEVVRVVGKHCESGDVLVANANIPEGVKVGDIIATPVTGAYGYSMASHYNRLLRPAVVFVRNGDARLVCRRESLDDLLRFDV